MIPQTLLWVGLIVAWLVVLVPMLAARHPKVNQVSDATLKTRLLHRGGSATLAVRRRVRPTASVAGAGSEEDDDRRTLDDELDELDEHDEVLFTSRGRVTKTEAAQVDEAAEPDEATDEVEEAHAFVDSDVDGLSGAGPLDGDTVEIVQVQRAEVAGKAAASEIIDVEEAPIIEARVVEDPLPGADDPTAPVDLVDRDEVTATDDVDDAEFEADDSEVAEVADVEAQADTDLDEAEYDEADDDEELTEEVAPVVRSEVERDDELDGELDDDAPLRRRGGFDPENDARLSEARYRSRQRVTILLGVLAVVALGAGLMNVPFAWFALGGVVVALALYLTYLRRTVRIEAEIRRRRMARLERARREREREAEIRDGIPAHMRRGGCIVMEIDDEDPAFDHLPRYRAEEFDFLQDRRDLHEPMERKVG